MTLDIDTTAIFIGTLLFQAGGFFWVSRQNETRLKKVEAAVEKLYERVGADTKATIRTMDRRLARVEGGLQQVLYQRWEPYHAEREEEKEVPDFP